MQLPSVRVELHAAVWRFKPSGLESSAALIVMIVKLVFSIYIWPNVGCFQAQHLRFPHWVNVVNGGGNVGQCYTTGNTPPNIGLTLADVATIVSHDPTVANVGIA